MKIERATAKDYGQLKMLWSIVFQEEAEFLENFFTQRFQAEHIVVARKGGEIVSALHALPSTYFQDNEEKKCSFIVGAATYANHRKQGIMSELLSYTKATTGHPITLFPAVRPFYEANGYFTTSFMEEYWIPKNMDSSEKDPVSAANGGQDLPFSDLDKIYREAPKEEGALMRDELSWAFLTSGYQLVSVEGAYAFIKDGIAVEAMAMDRDAATTLVSLLQNKQVERLRFIPNSPFATLLNGPFVQIPMGMSTEESMRGVYIAEQY